MRNAELAKQLNEVTQEEHAESVARWVLQRMADNKVMAGMADADGNKITDHEKLLEARLEFVIDVLMKLHPIELMAFKEAFEHDSMIKAFKTMSGIKP